MNSQQIITKLLVHLSLEEEFKNRDETKIFIPFSFAHRLETDMRIKTYKDIEFGGYRIVSGPFDEILAYNKVKNAQLVMTTHGDIVENSSSNSVVG
ncbi:hypothetical protein [Ekhidna sp.]|uniref:hypothetical protein n=1 Tax=Ekhidna sp. TaxID=2608089 RepID=UPI0032978796